MTMVARLVLFSFLFSATRNARQNTHDMRGKQVWRSLLYCPDDSQMQIWHSFLWQDFAADLWRNGIVGVFLIWAVFGGIILWQSWGDY